MKQRCPEIVPQWPEAQEYEANGFHCIITLTAAAALLWALAIDALEGHFVPVLPLHVVLPSQRSKPSGKK